MVRGRTGVPPAFEPQASTSPAALAEHARPTNAANGGIRTAGPAGPGGEGGSDGPSLRSSIGKPVSGEWPGGHRGSRGRRGTDGTALRIALLAVRVPVSTVGALEDGRDGGDGVIGERVVAAHPVEMLVPPVAVGIPDRQGVRAGGGGSGIARETGTHVVLAAPGQKTPFEAWPPLGSRW